MVKKGDCGIQQLIAKVVAFLETKLCLFCMAYWYHGEVKGIFEDDMPISVNKSNE